MSIRLQINLRRKVVQLSAAFFTTLFVVTGCKKETTDIGTSLQEGNLDVTTTDTFSLRTYSDELSPMESDETSISLLGAYNDPVFGGVNCGIVTQVTPSAFDPVFPPSAEVTVDSLVLSLAYASIKYYGNLEDITVEVYEIDDVLQRDDQEYYTDTEPTIIGSNLVVPGKETLSPDVVKEVVVGDDTLAAQLRIHLNPDLGTEFISQAESGLLNSDFQNSTFKGLYVKVSVDEGAPDFGIPSGSGTVLYFSLETLLSRLSMYYHDSEGETASFNFNINSNCARYNKIDYDREGTVIQEALETPELGQKEFYTQGGSIRAVIELPYILDFDQDGEGNLAPKIINKAELILPIQDFQLDPFDPSTSLFLARVVDEKLSTFTEDYGFGSTISGNTVAYNEENKEFRFAMTREIQALLKGDVENTGYRVYAPAFFASTVERIIFNGPDTELKDRPRLEITYTEY